MSDLINPIRVEGLNEMVAALKALEGEAAQDLSDVLAEAAGIVVAAAKRRAPVKSGALQESIRTGSKQLKSAVVSGGSAKVPYFGFIDYGNKVRSGHKVGRGDSVPRTFVPTGRILYPAFFSHEKDVTELLQEKLDALCKKHGLAVSDG